MGENAAYDITSELDPVGKVDDVQAKLEARRKEKEKEQELKQQEGSVKGGENDGPQETPEQIEARKEAEKKKREAEKAKREKEQQEQARIAREEELTASPWITSTHKVKKARVDLLDKLYYRMKGEDLFAGSKQDFYDEGLAMLEQKYVAEAAK